MARPLRLEYPGAVYHATSRGNEKRPIFTDDEERAEFLGVLCLMSTYFVIDSDIPAVLSLYKSKDERLKMQSVAVKPKYLIDEKGHKKAVVIGLKEYDGLMGLLEDLEDANDLLRAEREATSFTPYDKFRNAWLKA